MALGVQQPPSFLLQTPAPEEAPSATFLSLALCSCGYICPREALSPAWEAGPQFLAPNPAPAKGK